MAKNIMQRYEKLSEVASRRHSSVNSFSDVMDDHIIAPFSLTFIAGAGTMGSVLDTVRFGKAADYSETGRKRSKFEKGVVTVAKNICSGIYVAAGAVSAVASSLAVAALEAPIAVPMLMVDGCVVAVNKAYNRRIDKAREQVYELKKEIEFESVQ